MKHPTGFLPLLGFVVAMAGPGALPARAWTTIHTTAETLVISNEAPGYLITKLINAGYGSYTPYQAVQLLAGMSGASAAISSDFLALLHDEPASAQIFSTTLSQYSATGSGIGISDDGSVQVVSTSGSTYAGQSSTTTISTEATAVQNVRMVYTAGYTFPNGTPLTSWSVTNASGLVTTTYKVFSIAWALADATSVPSLSAWSLVLLTGLLVGAAALALRQSTRCRVAILPLLLIVVAMPPARAGTNTSQDTFVLSNEGNGLIAKLVKAGYGNYNIYQALVQVQGDTDPSVAGIVTNAFLAALAACPVSSQIFTMKPSDLNVAGAAYAISTDGTVRAVSIFGSTYYNKGLAGTSTLLSNITGVGNSLFTYSTTFDAPPIMSFSVTSGGVTTTYNVTGIAWAPSTSVPTLSQWGLFLLAGLLAGAAALALRRSTRAALLPVLLIGLAVLPARAGTNTSQDTFVLSNEANGLITQLVNAGYGNFNIYQGLLQLQTETDPSIAGIVPNAFLDALAACPASSQVFTLTRALNVSAPSARIARFGLSASSARPTRDKLEPPPWSRRSPGSAAVISRIPLLHRPSHPGASPATM